MKRILFAALLTLTNLTHAQSIVSVWTLYERYTTVPLGADLTQVQCQARAKALNQAKIYVCTLENTVTPAVPPSTGWAKIAAEGGSFVLAAPATVRYGYAPLNAWAQKDFAAGTYACSNAVFGDPAPGNGKECDKSATAPPPPPPPPPPASGAQTVTFTQSTEDFLNPGRGFYVSPKPSEMNVSTLTNFVNYWKTRLFLYSPDLSPYRNSALPASYLSALSTQLAAARSAGVKLIIWPQYNADSGGADAPIGIALQHIQQLGTVWAQNADVVPFFKAGYIGSYGEWWGSQNGLDSDANKLAIKNALLANTPATSMVYVRTPRDIQRWYPDPAAASAARIAFHNDCYLANDTDANTFSGLNDSLRTYAKGLTTFGFETCDNVSNPEQMRKTCAQALAENAAYHATWGNKSYAPTFVNAWTSGGCMDQISRFFGYRFFVSSITFDASAVAATVWNVGNSALFDDRILIVTLRNKATGATIAAPAGKLRTIASGATATLTAAIAPPVGAYDILLSAPDPFPSLASDVRYAVRFANADNGNQRWTAPYFATGATLVVQ